MRAHARHVVAAGALLVFADMWTGRADARSWRADQVPNAGNVADADGAAVGSNLCHTAGGGSARNPFGVVVEGLLADPTDQTETFWDAALAALDSDGDGATNGVELLDPNGTWTPGNTDPGDAALVTHPGDSTSVVGSVATDRAALVALYDATGGASWTDNTNWLSDEPLSEWAGVHRVDLDDGRLTHLDFSNGNGLTGPLPPELGNLDRLRQLVLRDNALTGSIPRELGRLVNLVELDLHGNALTDGIPGELGDLAQVNWLYLHENSLTGSIPSDLGNLTSLLWLRLADNELTG